MNQAWKSSQWFTSCWNHTDAVCAMREFPQKLQFHDVTLRDGEQQAGMALDAGQRLAIARQLAAAGVHRIETGMPAESAEDAELLETLASENLSAQLLAFARCMPEDVLTARKYGASGVVLKMTTSEHLLRKGVGRSLEWAMSSAIDALAAARESGLYSVLFTIDSTRTEIPAYLAFLERVCSEAPPDAIAVADSYGVATPEAIGSMIGELRQRFAVPIEIHCHDDFGLATACTLAGVAAGAEVAHVTVCGIGERAGNASLEEVAMALRCLYGIDCGIRTESLYALSQFVQQSGRFGLPSNRAIVGEGLYRIETDLVAGLHRRCKSNATLEYLPFLPQLAGRPGVEVVLGKGSGKASVAEQLEARGMEWAAADIETLAAQVRELAAREKRLLTACEFDDLIAEAMK
jgi:isopropylmalate/homocitrate/citramalate synthase